ncbi:Ankyrin repeat-containing protein [Vitis vinifera]|uniref:Ankyrin repeat-containing protein n=1 Tax=Vitis vinifera TaxID=29760 RepID=A0A438IDJ4_VITVI|nr:Ankyrin repeat-containing protein [Vitis vinifera]
MTTLHGSTPSPWRRAEGCVPPEGTIVSARNPSTHPSYLIEPPQPLVFDILIQRVHQAIAIAVAVDHDEISNLNSHVSFDSSHRKNTTLHIAARVENKKMVEALLSEGTPASLLTENSKHETPLHNAARSGHVHVVKFLIDWATESTDVETGGIQQVLRMRNMEGNTPLHEAVRNGHHSTVLVLMEANDSDLLVSLNNAGESPLFMAVDARASEIVKTIYQIQIHILFSIEVPTARRFSTRPF